MKQLQEERMKPEELSHSDEWFKSSLECLLGAEVSAVKMGVKKEIDRDKIALWVARNSK